MRAGKTCQGRNTHLDHPRSLSGAGASPGSPLDREPYAEPDRGAGAPREPFRELMPGQMPVVLRHFAEEAHRERRTEGPRHREVPRDVEAPGSRPTHGPDSDPSEAVPVDAVVIGPVRRNPIVAREHRLCRAGCRQGDQERQRLPARRLHAGGYTETLRFSQCIRFPIAWTQLLSSSGAPHVGQRDAHHQSPILSCALRFRRQASSS